MFDNLTTIGRLFFWGAPSAIPGRIGPVVVGPIEGRSWGAFSHVGQELNKSLWACPTRVHGDPTAAVILPAGSIGVIHTRIGGVPGRVGGARLRSAAMSVLDALLPCTVNAETSAGLGAATL
jgi:hypothetical protein